MFGAEAINHFSDRFPSIRNFAFEAHLATPTALAHHQGETKVHSTGPTLVFASVVRPSQNADCAGVLHAEVFAAGAFFFTPKCQSPHTPATSATTSAIYIPMLLPND